MHLGLTPWRISEELSAQELGEQAALAESWGYQSFWLPEHHFTQGGAIPDPLMWLASVATVTKQIKLGTTSYLIPLRNPVLAAEQVAVLDQLSEGRVILGLGRGYAKSLFDVFQVEARKKRAIFKDTLSVMKHAWEGGTVGVDERGNEVSISPLPIQQPHPPLWVAAFGPLALKQAGSHGLPYLASPMETQERLRNNYAIHRESCRAADQPIPREVPIMRSLFVSENQAVVGRIRDHLDQTSGSMVRADGSRSRVECDDWAIVGDAAFVRDQVAQYREELGITHMVVTRLRIGGVDRSQLENSVATAIEILS